MADYEDWLARWIAEDGERVLDLLRKVVAASGITRKELDQHIGWGPGYTSAVLTGRIELQQEHVAAILFGFGVHPRRLYEILHPKALPIGPVDATADLARLMARAGLSLEDVPREPAAAPAPMAPAEIKALIDDAIQRALAAAPSKKQRPKPPRKRKRAPTKPPHK